MALAAVLCLGACGTASKTQGAASVPKTAAAPTPTSTYPTEWGQGVPPWFTQKDYDDHVKQMASDAHDAGITDPPVPIIRWITPAEWPEVYAACMKAHGMTVSLETDASGVGVNANAPDGQEAAQDYADWVCSSEYPTMPDSEHGKPSEKTKRIYYNYEVGTLVPCLAKHGYVIPRSDIPSFEVFSEEYNGDKDWQPYGQLIEMGMPEAFGKVGMVCPQSPPDSELDYLYDTSSPDK
jgi:hypothetical protein